MGEKVMIDDGLESLLTGQQFRRFQERVYAPVTETYGLSLLDIRVLLYLSEHSKYNTAKDIVQRHHWTKSHVSKSIEELIEKGLILRVPDDTDRRKVRLLVCEKADPVLTKVRALHLTMYQVLFRGVEEEELAVVKRVAEKISGNIVQGLDIAVMNKVSQ